jgi:hypothetical protein
VSINMSNPIKYKLDDFTSDDECILIGIISSVPDYTICWHINKQLEINLSRGPDVKFALVQKSKPLFQPDLFTTQVDNELEMQRFSLHHVFKFEDEAFYSNYFLIGNKGSQTNLEPQLKKVNYFFEVNGIKAENADQLIFDLNVIEPIEMAYLIGKVSIINKLQLPI